MSAVWRAARAAVRRRRFQTIVLGVVVGLATTMIVVALGLMAASSDPFEQGYGRQRGAHLVAAFDNTKVSDMQLAQAAQRSEVEAVAGPFGQVTVDVPIEPGTRPFPLIIVGRSDPGGPVDQLNVWQGRWATKPGEIVLNQPPVGTETTSLGAQMAVPDGPTLTVVGFAYTVSRSADAWVTPDQMVALHPATTQMLYRFSHAATDAQISSGQSAVTAGTPSGVLLGSRSYLTVKASAISGAAIVVPFLMVFGVLGLVVAVLIVANLVSGAVVAGFRHIGVLKALGFTPTQVLAVYLAMVSIPAIISCVLGAVLGNLLAIPLLGHVFQTFGSGGIGVAGWVNAATLLGVPLVVALSALVPALRARSLSASEAISAGSTQHNGRGLRVQRWLSGTRLPRSVSLGMGLPLARPARSALTMATVVLGVASVTLAMGLAKSLTWYDKAESRADAVQVTMHAHRATPGEADFIPPGTVAPTLSDAADEAMLRSLPGAAHVTASNVLGVRLVGASQHLRVTFYRGESADLGYQVLNGHWPDGPGQVAVSERFLKQQGLAVGDNVTMEHSGQRTQVRIVAKVLLNSNSMILSNWETLALLSPTEQADFYEIQLKPGADRSAYLTAALAADPGLKADPEHKADTFIVLVLATVSLLTLMLGILAALGVFNTVILNTRERRRDLGMLKSIGMTPRQVTVMVVTSMAALGALGGLLGIPLGIVAHRLIMPAMAHAAQVAFPDSMLDVFPAQMLALLALAGAGIAALGAFLPARSAARTTIAEVLHNE